MVCRHTQKHRKQTRRTTAEKQQAKRKKVFVPQQQSFLDALFAVFTAPVR
jgi:hypothetical protein